jgi:hypothetical protein
LVRYVVNAVADGYGQDHGGEPKYTIELASKLLALPRHVGLGHEAMAPLEDIRADMEEYRKAA